MSVNTTATSTATNKTQVKVKIPRTNRIGLQNCEVYVSSDIVREVRPLLQRLNQKLFPLRGKKEEVRSRLAELAKTKPEHFSPSSINILLNS